MEDPVYFAIGNNKGKMKQQFFRNIRTQKAETTLVTGRAVSFKTVSDELIGDQTVILPSRDAFLFWRFFQCQPIISLYV
jgi:hypothetical protein